MMLTKETTYLVALASANDLMIICTRGELVHYNPPLRLMMGKCTKKIILVVSWRVLFVYCPKTAIKNLRLTIKKIFLSVCCCHELQWMVVVDKFSS